MGTRNSLGGTHRRAAGDLSNGWRGELVLAASDVQGRYVAAYLRLTTEDGEPEVDVERGFKGQGKLVLAPVVTERGASLVLERSSGVVQVFRAAATLGGGAHDVGDCL